MRKNIGRGIFLGFLFLFYVSICFVPKAQAATADFNFTAMTGQYYRPDNSNVWTESNLLNSYTSLSAYATGGTWCGIYPDQSLFEHVKFSYAISLPTGIKVTSAYIYMYGQLDENTSYPYFTRNYFNGAVTNWPSYGSAGWAATNVTNWFSTYSGGSITATQILDFTQQYYTNPYGSGYYNFSESTSLYLYNSSYPPYLRITYEYIPTTPAISSPVSGSNNKTGVTLSASSTVVGGAQITYSWQYSLDNISWTSICSTTSTSYNWTIPTSIPDNSSIYVRCMAGASGINSAYSAAIRFNKADDPAIAAKLAAESAELAAEGAKSSADNANLTAQKALSVVGKPCLEISSSNGATLTSNSTVTLNFVYSNEMGNLAGMTYCYRNRGGTWSTWTAISNTGYCLVSIPLSTGYNLLEIKVKNVDGVESKCAKFNIWRI